jgi:hypothetical protein
MKPKLFSFTKLKIIYGLILSTFFWAIHANAQQKPLLSTKEAPKIDVHTAVAQGDLSSSREATPCGRH